MLKYATLLSNNIPFVRIDFYIVDNTVYFGEITFFPASGLSPFYPNKYDKILGSLLNINTI